MRYFKPDFLFEHFSGITIKWLKENNITHIFSDLDSTLAAHDQHGTKEFEAWLSQLRENNVQLVILSNNNQSRVDIFTEPYRIVGYGKANKPATSKIQRIMDEVGAKSETSLFLGDQLFTDVWCGKRLKMITALVHPIEPEHEPWNVSLKRKAESVIRRGW
ncbi:YqeG family HAD IIIA-type phosphatase [Evansella cellulosilytica]|uniref:HAD superfamily (Subfamily IIIA) phosphatase, TIGR01668 n=1 Tax=Evansella cellulosilytica (strain ATCC 21833 / DSM 2522 / FERM P-1141 / JCM 9156 / N-4) TaxID=649639 RepID=E6TRY4_EVAC2|nr:YqeG family HAD IIIA-type phosphatase [Evansella cellulosilytica]ADU30638.1 HAD superfamily (subfamily IIIA) phosphatase, TIGR01668 [Evansella cellulosilytica DSM 2522]